MRALRQRIYARAILGGVVAPGLPALRRARSSPEDDVFGWRIRRPRWWDPAGTSERRKVRCPYCQPTGNDECLF